MAQTFKCLSSLMVAVACCFLNGATAEEREGKQILLSAAVPSFPVYYYASGRPVFVNAEETPTGTDARVSSKLLSPPDDYGTDAVSRTFFRFFGCPKCLICPEPVVCPPVPAKAITLSPAAGECLTTAGILTAGFAISACSSVSAASKGTIDVTFTADQSFVIGIAAVTPNTQVKLTCTVITAAVAKTQTGALVGNTPVTAFGFLQIIASGANGNRFKCSWESS